MKLLVSAATFGELKGILDYIVGTQLEPKQLINAKFYGLDIDFFVTGVGLPLTVYHLTKQVLSTQYDLALNLGLCGSFEQSQILIGHTVNITVEEFGDLGVNDNGEFKTLFEIGLLKPDDKPFESGVLHNPHSFSKMEMLTDHSAVRSLTVCTATGEISQVYKRQQKFGAQVENMEGAGFFYVMLQQGIPFFEVRAVSNYVEPRNKERWEIMKALDSLRKVGVNLLMELALRGF